MTALTRRDALLGATAAAVVTGAATAPLAFKAADVKAALAGEPVIGLSEQLRAASEAWFSAIDAFEEATNRVGINDSYYSGLVSVETPDGRACWGASEIKAAAEDGRLHYRLTPDERDAALAELERRQREYPKKCRELGIEPLRQAREHWKAQFWDLQARLLDTPATTPGGVLAKLRGFYHDAEIADMRTGGDPDTDLPVEFAASVYRDLERLAGGMPS